MLDIGAEENDELSLLARNLILSSFLFHELIQPNRDIYQTI